MWNVKMNLGTNTFWSAFLKSPAVAQHRAILTLSKKHATIHNVKNRCLKSVLASTRQKPIKKTIHCGLHPIQYEDVAVEEENTTGE